MPLVTIEDRNFSVGMIKDIPSWELPEGAIADCTNMIFDIPGVARQRQGATKLTTGAVTVFSTMLGWVYSQDGTPIEQLYGLNGKDGKFQAVTLATGAATDLGVWTTVNGIVGRAVRHFGFTHFPYYVGSTRSAGVVAGQTTTAAFTNTANVNVVANAQQFTLGGADTTANIVVGGLAVFQDVGVNVYVGRVVSVDSGTKFTCWPVPKATFTATTVTTRVADNVLGGRCACSFQNRLLYGNTVDLSSTGQTLVADRRVNYSPLPGEAGLPARLPWVAPRCSPAGPRSTDRDPGRRRSSPGGRQRQRAADPDHAGRRDLPRRRRADHGVRARRDVRHLADQHERGLPLDLSVQRTPRHRLASPEGVMLYTGGGRTPVDLTAGKVHTYWRNLTRGSSFAIHGSFYTRNHYVVSGTSGGSLFALCFNMDNQAWSFFSGPGTDVFSAPPRPTDPSVAFANRWWDQSAAAGSQTNGHVVRVENLFAPDVVGQTKLECDDNVLPCSITTAARSPDLNFESMMRRLNVRYALRTAFPARSTSRA
jgi:hypothetical protein